VDDALCTLAMVLDRHRGDLFAAIRAGRVHLDPDIVHDRPVRHMVAALNATIALHRATDFAECLAGLVMEFVALERAIRPVSQSTC
jgi:hypothetical protein